MSSFTIINTITIFICIKIFSKKAQIKQIIVNIGRSTFGIYLLHVIIMRLPFMNWFWIIRDELELNHMVMGMIDCSKIKSTFDWRPRIPVKPMLDLTVEWYESYLNKEDAVSNMRMQIEKWK